MTKWALLAAVVIAGAGCSRRAPQVDQTKTTGGTVDTSPQGQRGDQSGAGSGANSNPGGTTSEPQTNPNAPSENAVPGSSMYARDGGNEYTNPEPVGTAPYSSPITR